MLRSSSYSVIVPGYLKLGIFGFNPTRIVASGPLGRVIISVRTPINFTHEKSRLRWSRLVGSNSRWELANRIQNNNLKKLFSNLFDRLGNPDKASFKLIGRGFRVMCSHKERQLHLEVGYTQKKVIPLPVTVNVRVRNRYNFELTGIDSTRLRVLSLNIRNLRSPNKYTGKGILLNKEVVNLKQGKKTQY